jgi:hypothetical protein
MQTWVSCKSSILCDVDYDLCLSLRAVVFHPWRCELIMWGPMMWFEQWLEWWRWLIPPWHVVLESAKDRILGAYTPGQHMPPWVRYEAACLLIRNTIDCVSCSEEWELEWCMLNPHGARGAYGGNLSTTSGACGGNRSKAWHTPVVDLCNSM